MLLPNVVDAPFPISMIAMTDMMPITIPSVVSMDRKTLRRSAWIAVLQSLKKGRHRNQETLDCLGVDWLSSRQNCAEICRAIVVILVPPVHLARELFAWHERPHSSRASPISLSNRLLHAATQRAPGFQSKSSSPVRP